MIDSVYSDLTSNPIHRFHGAPKKNRDYKSIDRITIAPPQGVIPWPKRRCPKGIWCSIPVELPHGDSF